MKRIAIAILFLLNNKLYMKFKGGKYMFNKLNNEVKKASFKKLVKSLSEQEKKQLEKEIIFGNLIESLEADSFEKAYKENKK